MDFKINEVQQTAPVQQTQTTQPTDDTFKFMLASNIEEAGLAERLNLMMEEIVMQGDKIVKRMDVRDMRRYRTLIKDFMNEIVNRSHKFSRENFLDHLPRFAKSQIKIVKLNFHAKISNKSPRISSTFASIAILSHSSLTSAWANSSNFSSTSRIMP